MLHHASVLCAVLLLASTALPAPLLAHELDAEVITSGEYTYKVKGEGFPEKLEKELLGMTEAEKRIKTPPPTLYLLERRLKKDAETLEKALAAKGYYDAKVQVQIRADEEPYKAVFIATTGEVYTLKAIRLVLDSGYDETRYTLPPAESLGLPIHEQLDYDKVLAARSTLRDRIHAENCLRNVRVRVHLRIDPNTKEAEAIYRINPGVDATFGALNINGLQMVDSVYIERKLPWKEGECFKPKKLEDLQVKLLQSNLFSKIDFSMPDEPDETGEFPVTLNVVERKHRTIKVGIGFATEEGFDLTPSWEHRNIFGEGEKLTVESTLSTFEQSLRTRLERQDFLQRDQKLTLNNSLSRYDTDAYESRGVSFGGQISRPLWPNVTGAVGVSYSLREVEDFADNSRTTYSLVSLPSYLLYNTRNSELDPTKGVYLRVDGMPYFDMLNDNQTFFKLLGTARFYHQQETWPLEPVLALRATMGSILGSGRLSIPADERFYSGGGGSVRGYGYQMLGPLDGDNPIGGRSLMEFSGELRLRVTESIGIVPFVDAGNVYDTITPEFSGDLYYAAGLGFRYYTGFGPFRFDVAFPLDKRAGVDDSYQIYLSFGQAF